MLLALNANAAVDRVIFVDRFRAGGTMRTDRERVCVGGKGLDVAQVLVTLGAPVKALSFIAGDNGRLLEGLLKQRGIPAHYIWVEGETRVAYVIVESKANRHSHITLSGYTVTPDDCRKYFQEVQRLAGSASWALIAGSLPGGAPTDFYRQLIDILHRQQVKVLLDCAGTPARLALPAAPEVFKMNAVEYRETFGKTPHSVMDWQQAYQELRAEGMDGSLVITQGAEGMLAFTPEGTFLAHGPKLKEVNAAGSGDAASAALVYRLSLGEGWLEALRWAVATSGAVVLTEGTAECRTEDIHCLLPQARISRVL